MDSVLNIYNRLDSFDWTYGVTPLSQWEHIAVASVGYLATIFALRYLTPAPMRFRWLQALHNLFLTLLSVAMLTGVLSEAFFALRRGDSLFDLYCDPKHKFGHGKIEFWVWVFHLSKIYEFIDTIFIALAHKPLDFLHVYHHVLTLWVTWFGMYTDTTFQWMGVATNTFVHTLMYFYYFASTFGYQAPWKRYLTQIQMIQFWFNTAVLVLWIAIKHLYGAPCVARTDSVLLVIFANVTFFLLFLRFYRRTYTKNAAAKAAAASKPKKTN